MKTARFLDVGPVEGRKASAYGNFLRRRTKLTRNAWRDEWLQKITRSRGLDRLFKELLVKDISRQKTSKYVSKSKQMRTFSTSKHVIGTCLYSPFYYDLLQEKINIAFYVGSLVTCAIFFLRKLSDKPIKSPRSGSARECWNKAKAKRNK